MVLPKALEDMEYILATDVGSTTTKARFFYKQDGVWRFYVAGEAPTTVEAPYEDVTLGVTNAVREIEELTNHKILSADGSGIKVPFDGTSGVDLYCTTSSAGGGLQMMVGGLVKTMTAESANRAALGAGSIVMDVLSVDDGRQNFEKIKLIRSLRPDMILQAGGTDGGDIEHVMEMAELIKSAKPRPRLGLGYDLPYVYAGNKNAAPHIRELAEGAFALNVVENIRPVLELENTEPARRAIHELFMEHVMSHAPGYQKLMTWANIDIMPTPAAEGLAIQLIANTYEKNVLGVGLGGATTNVYSVFDERFVRSVSANLGMSYSVTNVLKEAGLDNVQRWMPFALSELDLKNRLMNKMIRPTTIPQTLEELVVEHSVAREALRLGLLHHKSIATRLKGVKQVHDDMGWMFDAAVAESYIDMMEIDIVAGTGGLLSHAPDRAQTLLVLTDAFQPMGITWLFQDSVFMMPHLGLLSTVHSKASWEIFDRDCLVRLGTVIAAKGVAKPGTPVMTVEITMPDGSVTEESVVFGEIKRLHLGVNESAQVRVIAERGFEVSNEGVREITGEASGGEVGLVLDGRGRPIAMESDPDARIQQIKSWFKSMEIYEELEESQ